MDAVLAKAQHSLAQKQRELAKESRFHLNEDAAAGGGGGPLVRETEELWKTTSDLREEFERGVPLTDPVAQIQQKEIQLLVAEKQYSVGEKTIRLIQAHLISAMDPGPGPGGSALGRQSDVRRAEEMKKQGQFLLSEASDLLKKARHTVTFAEMGARFQGRQGSFRGNKGRDNKGFVEDRFSHNNNRPLSLDIPSQDPTPAADYNQYDAHDPSPQPHPQQQQQPMHGSPHISQEGYPYSRWNNNNNNTGPPPLESPTSPPPPKSVHYDQQQMPPGQQAYGDPSSTDLEFQRRNKEDCRVCTFRNCCILFLLLALAGIGVGVWLLFHFNVIKT